MQLAINRKIIELAAAQNKSEDQSAAEKEELDASVPDSAGPEEQNNAVAPEQPVDTSENANAPEEAENDDKPVAEEAAIASANTEAAQQEPIVEAPETSEEPVGTYSFSSVIGTRQKILTHHVLSSRVYASCTTELYHACMYFFCRESRHRARCCAQHPLNSRPSHPTCIFPSTTSISFLLASVIHFFRDCCHTRSLL
jgi:hypothetical protein